MYHKYTKEEDELIVRAIKHSPTNLTLAFRKVAKKLNVTERSVRKRYYSKIQKDKDKLFLVVSPKKAATNYKNTFCGKRTTGKKETPTKISKWKRILAILME